LAARFRAQHKRYASGKNSLLALDARLPFAGFFYLETIQFLRKRGYGL